MSDTKEKVKEISVSLLGPSAAFILGLFVFLVVLAMVGLGQEAIAIFWMMLWIFFGIVVLVGVIILIVIVVLVVAS